MCVCAFLVIIVKHSLMLNSGNWNCNEGRLKKPKKEIGAIGRILFARIPSEKLDNASGSNEIENGEKCP
ncbi:hypothetical protein AGMMS49521_3510 [Campylobacterota bacterium]|nr:hypothetical protein AGMMS49521_3510 [Campylobacterota bacterium]